MELLRVQDDLRRNIEALATHLRKLEMPPETVVTAVKSISYEAARTIPLPLPNIERLALTRDLVRWAVDAYYAA